MREKRRLFVVVILMAPGGRTTSTSGQTITGEIGGRQITVGNEAEERHNCQAAAASQH
jgi:hypothetical protein